FPNDAGYRGISSSPRRVTACTGAMTIMRSWPKSPRCRAVLPARPRKKRPSAIPRRPFAYGLLLPRGALWHTRWGRAGRAPHEPSGRTAGGHGGCARGWWKRPFDFLILMRITGGEEIKTAGRVLRVCGPVSIEQLHRRVALLE